VILILAVIGAVTCAIAPAVNSFAMLIVLAIFSGSLMSMLGSLANILILSGTPLASQGRMLSALHTMYGIGAAFASWSVGYSITHGIRWWMLFTGCLPLFLMLYPLAAKRKEVQIPEEKEARFQSPRLFGFQYLAMTVFCLYVAGEVTTSMWMTSWLMNTKNLSIETATTILSSYFIVLLAARFLCAMFVTQKLEKAILLLSLALPPVVLFLVISDLVSPWFLLAIGLYGPFFPVYLARVSRSSPSNWRSLTIWTIVAMNLLLALGHLFLGKLADNFGIGTAYFLPVASLSLAFIALCLYFLRERQLLS